MTENKDNKRTRIFTLKELEEFDGKEGRPFYVVFEGKVYDLSKSQLWIEGSHMGIHTRDENLSETIKEAPHTKETLERLPVIGTLGEQPKLTPSPPAVEEKPVEVLAEQPAQPLAMSRREFLKLAAAGGGAITILALTSPLKA